MTGVRDARVSRLPPFVHARTFRTSAPHRAGRSLLTRLETPAVAVLAFVLLAAAMSRAFTIYDEGIVFAGAMRVLDGEVIHRDFYSQYGPGQYYVVALLLKLFPDGFIAARIWDALVRAASVTLVYASVRRHAAIPIALFGAAIAGVLQLSPFYLLAVSVCTPLGLAATALVARAPFSPRVDRLLLAAGACTGLSAIFRYDVGLYTAVANGAAILVLARANANADPWWSTSVRRGAIYAAGVALVFLPVAVAFLLVASPTTFLDDAVRTALSGYVTMRSLPIPGLEAIRADHALALPFVPLLAVGLGVMATTLRPKRGLDPVAASIFAFALLALLGYAKGYVRFSTVQMMFALMPAVVVLGLVLSTWWRSGPAARIAAAALAIVVAVPIQASLAQSYWAVRWDLDRTFGGWLAAKAGLIHPNPALAPACATGPVLTSAVTTADYARVAHYLAAHSKPSEPILAALDRHDKVYASPAGLYYLAGRLPGSHWHHFDPGIQTRDDVQRAMIEELRRNGVRWVVRDASFSDFNEPNASAVSSGVKLLDTYLDQNFRPVARSGKLEIWLLNGQNPEPAAPGPCEAAAVTP